TRAQETLTLSFAKARMKWGKPRPSIPSRFLMEMRGDTERAQKAALAAEAMYRSALTAGSRKEEGNEDASSEKSKKRRSPAARGTKTRNAAR
ncbi:MAG TPA: hypothetical protein VIM73_04165, partial [Polyangiaceae bacterium]